MTDDFADRSPRTFPSPARKGAASRLMIFVAYMPTHVYIFTPCREMWPAPSVNARLPRVPVLNKNGQPKRQERQTRHHPRDALGSTRIGRSSR